MNSIPKDLTPAADGREARRTGVFVSASIEVEGIRRLVRVRNLSISGALLEANAIPSVNSKIVLIYKEHVAAASVIWSQGRRFGVKFSEPIQIYDWLTEQIATSIVAGDDAIEPDFSTHDVLSDEEIEMKLPGRIADQVEYAARIMELFAGLVSKDSHLLQRYSSNLQQMDMSRENLVALAKILRSPDKIAAVKESRPKSLQVKLTRR